MEYLTTTFSPAMLKPGCIAYIEEVDLEVVKTALPHLTSAVGHEVTAKILSALLEGEVPFNRVNLALDAWDEVYCVIPNFRASEAREFTREEVESAGFRCFHVLVRR